MAAGKGLHVRLPDPKAAQRAATVAAATAALLLCCLAGLVVQHYRYQNPLLRYLSRPGWAVRGYAAWRSPAPSRRPCILCGPISSGSTAGGRGTGASRRNGAPPFPPPPRPPPPPPHCSFRGPLPLGAVRWSQANATADQLAVRGCQLRRFSHAQAQRCLAGKRLVFVGDSVTRYQYLTLLYFLERGDWPAPLGGVPGEPSVANEHEWPSWNDFLRGTNRLFNGRELCDCFRADWVPGSGWKPPEDEKHENRFYRRRLGGAGGDIFVSHLTYTTYPNRMHGHYGFPPYLKGRRPCAPATCNFPADWAHHLAEGLTGPVKDLGPTHLIVNSGLWASSNALPDWHAIAAAGVAAVAPQGGRAIWRGTTANRGRKVPVQPGHDARAIQHTQAAGWDLLDAYNITRPLLSMKRRPMWDGRHFLAGVYREINLYLLNMICQDEGSSSEDDGSGSGSGGKPPVSGSSRGSSSKKEHG
ncbi:hypothetical protein ABPG77_006333 [Micractinium sp. CCAP 211/92]